MLRVVKTILHVGNRCLTSWCSFILCLSSVLSAFSTSHAAILQNDGDGKHFEIIEDVSNVHGRVGVSDTVYFLGIFDYEEQCRRVCFGTTDAYWDPSTDPGAVSSRPSAPNSLPPPPQAENDSTLAGSAASPSSISAPAASDDDEDDMAGSFEYSGVPRHQASTGRVDEYLQQFAGPAAAVAGGAAAVNVSGGGGGGGGGGEEGDMPVCRILEWRLLRRVQFGGEEERMVLAGRSCSICGIWGCDLCAARQIIRGEAGARYAEKKKGRGRWMQVCREEEGQPALEVRYSHDPDHAPHADVIMFPATGDFRRFTFPPRPPNQAWVAIAGESSVWWPHVEALVDDPRFQLVMGYSRQMSHMHASYLPHNFSALRRPPSGPWLRRRRHTEAGGGGGDVTRGDSGGGDAAAETGGGGDGGDVEGDVDGWSDLVEEARAVEPTADIVYFASNCRADYRQAWVEELMRHIPIDAYGHCLKNKFLPPSLAALEARPDPDGLTDRPPSPFGGGGGGGGGGRGGVPARTAQGAQSAVKRAVTSRYKFGLAFENTRENDYITEKLFEVLAAGAVPVYLGAPNWRELVPMADGVVDAADFESPQDLAAYLRRLVDDEDLYYMYHRWRDEPVPEWGRALESTSFKWNLCRACRWWHSRRA